MKSRHDGIHPHLEEFLVSLTTRFYDKLLTRLGHAQNRYRAQGTLRAILSQWGAFRVCYRGVVVRAVFTTEPKAHPLAFGLPRIEWDHCEGTPFQLLCAVKMGGKTPWSLFVPSPLGEAGICIYAIWSTAVSYTHLTLPTKRIV